MESPRLIFPEALLLQMTPEPDNKMLRIFLQSNLNICIALNLTS